MYTDKNFKMTTLKGECAYCRQKRIERKGERWQEGQDIHAPWYSHYICLDCGERFTLVEKE